MKKIYLNIAILICSFSYSQVFINEVDADTVGADNKEFIELKSTNPNFSLNGYVLVFFNGTSAGTGNLSYLALDLDGLTTDANGNILIGNSLVSPTPALEIPNNTIQNGPDGIGLYLGDATDFPLDTPANSINLVDSLCYTANFNSSPTLLLSSFGTTISVNEGLNTNAPTQSMQRKLDGTFEVKAPTPAINNDGSGIVLTYVSTTINATILSEGQTLTINCSSSQPVTMADLIISFTLNNGNFNSSDYSGTFNVTIPVGQTTAGRTIAILNDGVNEGDENAKLTLTSPNSVYNLNNNNIIVRIKDANFVVLPFGNPASPTYGTVINQKPVGYYDSLNGLSGNALKQEIQNIIANPAVVRKHNYADVYTILKEADQNPSNSNEVWLMYVEQPKSKLDQQVSSSNIGSWNREHIYCQSRGGFNLDSNVFPDGINIFSPTDANDIEAGGTDAHHLRAEDGPENSLRNNRNYGSADYYGPATTQGTWKGDVARALFYMAVRYNNLNVVNGYPAESPDGFIGDLATLLTWNNQDPADDFEMNRNNIVFNWQKNRNPFIDMPHLASYIFGANFGQPWSNSLAVANIENELQVKIFPNPANNFLVFEGLKSETKIEIFNSLGEKVHEEVQNKIERINLDLASGIYLVKIISDNKSVIKKLLIQ